MTKQGEISLIPRGRFGTGLVHEPYPGAYAAFDGNAFEGVGHRTARHGAKGSAAARKRRRKQGRRKC